MARVIEYNLKPHFPKISIFEPEKKTGRYPPGFANKIINHITEYPPLVVAVHDYTTERVLADMGIRVEHKLEKSKSCSLIAEKKK